MSAIFLMTSLTILSRISGQITIGAVSQNNRIERVAPCWCVVRHVKEPYEMSMALGARP